MSSTSSDDEDARDTLVLDIGSGTLKCGVAGEDGPDLVLPSMVGRTKDRLCQLGCGYDHYVGNDAQTMRGLLSLKYPVRNGVVQDWDDFEKMLMHTFLNMKDISPLEECAILVTEALNNPRKNREKLIEVLFEKFDFASAYVGLQSNLALYSLGRATGVVVDIGAGVTQIQPISNGFTKERSWSRMDVAGSDLTDYMMTMLNQRGNSFVTSNEREIVREIKEQQCYLALDYDKEMQTSQESFECDRTYELPDGKHITIGHERFMCPEAIFQPHMVGSDSLGVHELVYNAIQKCDVDLRKDLYRNIVVCGGSTLFEGFRARMEKEIAQLIPSHIEPRVVAAPERKYHTWIGGSILASLGYFQQKWLSKQEYRNAGPERVSKELFDMI